MREDIRIFDEINERYDIEKYSYREIIWLFSEFILIVINQADGKHLSSAECECVRNFVIKARAFLKQEVSREEFTELRIQCWELHDEQKVDYQKKLYRILVMFLYDKEIFDKQYQFELFELYLNLLLDLEMGMPQRFLDTMFGAPYCSFNLKEKLTKSEEPLIDVSSCISYYNAGVGYFQEPQYWLEDKQQHYLIFGHTITGYLAIAVNNQQIVQLVENMECEDAIVTIYCNRDMEAFINCQRLFMGKVSEMLSAGNLTDCEWDFDLFFKQFLAYDDTITAESYWEECVYSLEELFYPLNDVHIKFFEKYTKKSIDGEKV